MVRDNIFRLLAVLALFVAFMGNVVTYHVGKNADENLCQEIADSRKPLIQIVERSKKTLPTLDYYKKHPNDLKIQLKRANQALNDLKMDTC